MSELRAIEALRKQVKKEPFTSGEKKAVNHGINELETIVGTVALFSDMAKRWDDELEPKLKALKGVSDDTVDTLTGLVMTIEEAGAYGDRPKIQKILTVVTHRINVPSLVKVCEGPEGPYTDIYDEDGNTLLEIK